MRRAPVVTEFRLDTSHVKDITYSDWDALILVIWKQTQTEASPIRMDAVKPRSSGALDRGP